MLPNHSPWIQQLNRTRPIVPLQHSVSTDVTIVGGGIAGVCTAYFSLRHTTRRVVILEADKVAHGATGHNAGQITSYFERPLTELVNEFGFDLAIAGQRAIESAWQLLDRIVADASLQTPVYKFTGYAGLSSLEQILAHLKNNRLRVRGGLPAESLVVAEDWPEKTAIPAEYADLYVTAPAASVRDLLETDHPGYCAALSYQKGGMNTALFVEELVGYLLATYPERFSVFEGSPVSTVALETTAARLTVGAHTVSAQQVVLCTNGFENLTIRNHTGADIDTAFHHLVSGRIGSMVGYIDSLNRPPAAISYFPTEQTAGGDPTGETYFYLTRRPYEHQGQAGSNLICVGGPEQSLPNGATYSRDTSCSPSQRAAIDDFLRDNFRPYPQSAPTETFCWHGLMGYTPNGVRRVGPEPRNRRLFYNLGCNGVGILPSIFGGHRISRYLAGEQVEPSIFDPLEQ